MEVQKNILSKIKDETDQHLKGELFPLISQLVETKMKEERDKFFDETNILGDVFPKLVGSGLFRTCGKCCRCTRTNEEIVFNEDYLKECAYKIGVSSENYNLRNDEYILVCSAYGYLHECYPLGISYTNDRVSGTKKTLVVKDHFRGEYLTNYGSIIYLYKDQRGTRYNIYHEGQNMLSQEFITYYNNYIDYSSSHLRKDGYGSSRLTHNDLKNIVKTYDQYNPKASENYRIEKQKEEIEKMTLNLQQRETEIVQDEKILHEKQIEFIKEIEKFTEEKKIHKEKSKNLLRRENNVFLKESIKSVHQELKDISYSLSDTIDLLDDIDPSIEQRLNQMIQKINTMFSEELVVEAVEVQ